MNKNILKKTVLYAGIILFFAVLAYGFVPQVLGGKIVNQSDISQWNGMTREIYLHNQANPEDPTLWTNSMFGGMPTVTMYDDFKGDWTKPVYDFLLSGLRPANYLFIALVGGFLLMLSMGVGIITAIGGAVAVAFCSYNMQIIQVGHNTKMQAIAFMPWVLAGMIFTYNSMMNRARPVRKTLAKCFLGAGLFALALSFQIKANHPQITYYLAIIIFIYALVLLIRILADRNNRKDMLVRFFTASAMLLLVGCTGIATNLNKLIPTYEYAKYTMRGGSELASKDGTENSKGLDLDYATAWSYGIEETPNLFIPNFNGGASTGSFDENSETYKLLKRAGQPNSEEIVKQLPSYWGPQPFTAGPMYIGAISFFLFILGLLLFKGKEKWWLLAASVLAVLMAWGSHLMWFTRLLFEYAPMYNKFRTVSMALVILQVTVPAAGFLVLDRILKREYARKELYTKGGIAFGITAGFCLLSAFFPGIAGNFISGADASFQEILAETFAEDRRTLLVDDAYRSFFLVTLTFALIMWAYRKKDISAAKGSTLIAGTAICILVLFDLTSVGKRYLNGDHFISKRNFGSQFAERPADAAILEDKNLSYRVLDISVKTFNDAHPSYYHKNIGGYSPAKLQRYQDLIENYLGPEINSVFYTVNKFGTAGEIERNLPEIPVISMLNGKYIIVQPDYPPITNRHAMGNCWIVDSVAAASSPDEEIALLGVADLHTTAVIGDDFPEARKKVAEIGQTGSEHAGDTVFMTHYAPNELKYKYDLSADRAVVFSEIFYPKGWHASLDSGENVDIFRADWILRGVILPAGKGELTMRFDPQSYKTGENLSRASSILLIILILLSGFMTAADWKRKSQEQQSEPDSE